MGTVTQYNLQNVQAALGGSNPISMNEYYRGGSFVPSTRNTTTQTREPTSGQYYQNGTSWRVYTSGYNPGATTGYDYSILWFYTSITNSGAASGSVTVGNITYYRGTLASFNFDGTYIVSVNEYGIYRITTTGGTVSINTGVPSSGQISISQLFGAENP